MNIYFYKDMLQFSERQKTFDCKLQWYLKFYNKVILLIGCKNLSVIIGFSLIGSKLKVSKLFNKQFNR